MSFQSTISSLRDKAGDVSETPHAALLIVESPNYAFLVDLVSDAARLGITAHIHDVDSDEPLEDEDLEGLTVRVQLIKRPPNDGVVDFIFEDLAADWIRETPEQFEKTKLLMVLLAAQGGRTAGTVVTNVPNTSSPSTGETFASPGRLVRHLSRGADVPASIAAWIIRETPAAPSPVFDAIAEMAAKRLPLALVSELWREGDQEVLFASFQGGRRLKLEVSGLDASAPSDELHAAIEWIYARNEDAETKHGLLAAEIAREWKSEEKLGNGLQDLLAHALENARTAFSIKIRNLSTDALKLMSELRKNLTSDIQAATSYSSALTSTLWRDAALAFGAMLLRSVSVDIKDADWVPLLAFAYLIGAGIMNYWQFKNGIKAVLSGAQQFRSRVYGYLSDDDYEAIYASQIRGVVHRAEAQARAVLTLYICTALLCIGTAAL